MSNIYKPTTTERIDDVRAMLKSIQDCQADSEVTEHYDCVSDIDYAIDQLQMLKQEIGG